MSDYRYIVSKAIKEFEMVIKINHNNLGYIYYSQKKYREALKEYQNVLNLAPDHINAKLKIKQINELISN